MKVCIKCKTTKPVTDFKEKAKYEDGRDGRCIECRQHEVERMAAYTAANKEKARVRRAAYDAAYAAANKEKIRVRQAAYYANNREKVAARNAAWYAANPDKTRAARAAWLAANADKEAARWARYYTNNREEIMARAVRQGAIRRARKSDLDCDGHTAADLAASYAKDNLTNCVYCDGPYEHDDHVVPISRGGPHILANLVPACRRCNCSKGARLVSEWRPDHWLANVTRTA